MLKKILFALLIIFLLAQFIRPPKNEGSAISATDISHSVAVPDSIMAMLKTSCYDCHSDHTNYPWYSMITPVNWWLNSHIKDGKRGLNFSIFSTYSFRKKAKRFDDIAETVEKHQMPLNSYLWIHKDAKLNESQIKMITDWASVSKEKIMQDSLQSVH